MVLLDLLYQVFPYLWLIVVILPEKDNIIEAANKRVVEIEDNFKMGLISNEEKKRLSQSVWMEITEDIAEKTWATLDIDSPIRLLLPLVSNVLPKIKSNNFPVCEDLWSILRVKSFNLPTKSNFREGLSVFEYITGARGTRKGFGRYCSKNCRCRLFDPTFGRCMLIVCHYP